MTENQPSDPPKTGSGKGMLARLVAAALVGLIIMVECLVTYLVLPSPDAVSKGLETFAEVGTATSPPQAPVVEVPLGRFSVTKHRPAHNSSVRIQFSLVYIVLKQDKREFSALLEDRVNRLRDRVIFTVTNSELTDLTDPGLDLIKRRILETSNDLFGKDIVHSAIFSDYVFIEQ